MSAEQIIADAIWRGVTITTARAKPLAAEVLKALAEAGYVVVPREPTMRQLTAAARAWREDPCRRSSTLYRAMLDSAQEG